MQRCTFSFSNYSITVKGKSIEFCYRRKEWSRERERERERKIEKKRASRDKNGKKRGREEQIPGNIVRPDEDKGKEEASAKIKREMRDKK